MQNGYTSEEYYRRVLIPIIEKERKRLYESPFAQFLKNEGVQKCMEEGGVKYALQNRNHPYNFEGKSIPLREIVGRLSKVNLEGLVGDISKCYQNAREAIQKRGGNAEATKQALDLCDSLEAEDKENAAKIHAMGRKFNKRIYFFEIFGQ